MPTNWEDIRFSGDDEDVKELHEVYRIGNFLDTYEERKRVYDLGLRKYYLKHGILLTEHSHPGSSKSMKK